MDFQGDPIRLDSSCWDDPGRPECQFGNPTSILWPFDHNQLLPMDIFIFDAIARISWPIWNG